MQYANFAHAPTYIVSLTQPVKRGEAKFIVTQKDASLYIKCDRNEMKWSDRDSGAENPTRETKTNIQLTHFAQSL